MKFRKAQIIVLVDIMLSITLLVLLVAPFMIASLKGLRKCRRYMAVYEDYRVKLRNEDFHFISIIKPEKLYSIYERSKGIIVILPFNETNVEVWGIKI